MVKFIDARIKTINEILQSVKVIKLYAWEDSFAKRVTDARNNEMDVMQKFSNYVCIVCIRTVACFFFDQLDLI